MRVLVVSSEPVAARMAGPAIRSYELARALARRFDVTLAAPAPPPGETVPIEAPLTYLPAGLADYHTLARAIAAHDVVVAQQLPPRLLSRIWRLPTRLAVDLYNPTVVEVLPASASRPPAAAGRQRRVAVEAAAAHLAAADLVLCASERQRDLWLGGMGLRGLLAGGAPVAVVPFGTPTARPAAEAGGGPIRREWPAIGADDRVLLWGGGIWDWLDAPTAIRATGLLRDRSPAVHLVFPGVRRPAMAERDRHRAAADAVALATSLGLEGRRVHFGSGWVPYAERGAWLLDADIGVSAHPAGLEAHFAFRTRVLDYLWAGLPVVATAGDALAARVAAAGAGREVPAGDAEAFAAACVALLDAPADAKAAASTLGAGLAWDRVVEPLVDWIEHGPKLAATRARRRAVQAATLAQYGPIVRETLTTDGPAHLVRKLGANLGRAVRRR
jgi:hypothetical protein